jgi:hypothetical protein
MIGAEGFVLSFALAFTGAQVSNLDQRARYEDAAKAAAEKSYEDTGMKQMVDQSLKDIERKYINKEVLRYGSATVTVIRVLSERRLILTYEF